MRRVVVTGLGAITPIGNTVPQMWESVKAGKCGIDKIKGFDTSELDTKIAAEVNADDVKNLIASKFGKRESKKMTKNTHLFLAEKPNCSFWVLHI